jgi:hypothetical protein
MFGLAWLNRGVEYGFFRAEQQGNESSSSHAKRTIAQGETEGWGKIISRLIAGGHACSEIADYSLGQIKIFSKYATELERERRASLIADLAIASQGNSKGIGEAINNLLS